MVSKQFLKFQVIADILTAHYLDFIHVSFIQLSVANANTGKM